MSRKEKKVVGLVRVGVTVEVTIQVLNHRLRLNWRNIFFYWLLSFLLIYHAEGQYKDSPWWDFAYYFWHSMLITIAILGFFQYEPATIRTFYPILFYSILRSCLYIIVMVLQVDMNARAVVTIVFLTALAATVYITINQTKK